MHLKGENTQYEKKEQATKLDHGRDGEINRQEI
jgi:hypothetical protein